MKRFFGGVVGTIIVGAAAIYAHAQVPRADIPMVSGRAQTGDTFIFRRGGQAARGRLNEFLVPGQAGPSGPAGPQGPAGAKGDTGPQGLAGVAGAQGPKGDNGPSGPQGAKGETGAQGPAGATGATGATGPAGSANNVQFTGSVTIGQLLTLGTFTRDITISGILATDRINVMVLADLPADVALTQARPTAANTVRLYFRGFSLLTANTPISVAITALR